MATRCSDANSYLTSKSPTMRLQTSSLIPVSEHTRAQLKPPLSLCLTKTQALPDHRHSTMSPKEMPRTANGILSILNVLNPNRVHQIPSVPLRVPSNSMIGKSTLTDLPLMHSQSGSFEKNRSRSCIVFLSGSPREGMSRSPRFQSRRPVRYPPTTVPLACAPSNR